MAVEVEWGERGGWWWVATAGGGGWRVTGERHGRWEGEVRWSRRSCSGREDGVRRMQRVNHSP
eukprot:COSAG02_NODE_57995_length_279_cov_0.405556_1_plen_62_part_01